MHECGRPYRYKVVWYYRQFGLADRHSCCLARHLASMLKAGNSGSVSVLEISTVQMTSATSSTEHQRASDENASLRFTGIDQSEVRWQQFPRLEIGDGYVNDQTHD